MKDKKAEEVIKEFAWQMWGRKYDVFNECTEVVLTNPCTVSSEINGVDMQHFELIINVPHGNFSIHQYFGQTFGFNPENNDPVVFFIEEDEISKSEIRMINEILDDFPLFCEKLIDSIYFNKEDGQWYAYEHFVKWVEHLNNGGEYANDVDWIDQALNDDDVSKRIENKIIKK